MNSVNVKVTVLTEVGSEKHESIFETIEPCEPNERQIDGILRYAMGCHIIDCQTISPWAKKKELCHCSEPSSPLT